MEKPNLNPEILAAVQANDLENGNNGGQRRQPPLFLNDVIRFITPESGNVTELLVSNAATDQVRADNSVVHINAWAGLRAHDTRVFSVARLFGYANSIITTDGTPFLVSETRNERVAEFLQYVAANPNGIALRLIAECEHRGRFYSTFRVEGAVVNPFETETAEAVEPETPIRRPRNRNNR